MPPDYLINNNNSFFLVILRKLYKTASFQIPAFLDVGHVVSHVTKKVFDVVLLNYNYTLTVISLVNLYRIIFKISEMYSFLVELCSLERDYLFIFMRFSSASLDIQNRLGNMSSKYYFYSFSYN